MADDALSGSAADDLPPGTMVGDYRLTRRVAVGGMGEVYAAEQPVIGKRVAVKVIRADLCNDQAELARFVHEARTVSSLRHPGLVDVYGFGTLPDGRSYFVMEWLHGESLAERMEREPLKLGEALAIFGQITDALLVVHEQKIIHRDLKPENIFLVPVGDDRMIVKLLDFGLAKLVTAEGSQRLTRPGTILGTPEYMSPEQGRGREIDLKSDVYSLGCVAYEMILGESPFSGDSPGDLLLAHVLDRPRPPRQLWPSLPEPIDTLLLWMLEKDPAKRPTIPMVRAALRAMGAIDSARFVLPAPGVMPASSREVAALRTPARVLSGQDVGPVEPRRRRVARTVAAVVAAVLLAALALWLSLASS
jgi:eukaryotic-like serine/threonine-protein kinase